MDTLTLLRSGQLSGIKRLDLSCGLTEFPSEILDLADSLEILNLCDNHLTSLPDDFGRLKNLKVVFFNNNPFEHIPAVLAQCPDLYMISFKANRVRTIAEEIFSLNLRWLTLTDNQIETLSPAIGKLGQLQKLLLAGNCLQTLPAELASCQNLELIRLAANHLTELPPWLLTMPRLSWLAYAGNPFCAETAPKERSLQAIAWDTLSIGKILGQGASGVIYKGIWTGQDTPQTVAVKIFKGEITSDGFPDDEMQACIAAGSHDNLVQVLGKLSHCPDGREGLVFSFIPPHYKNLGGPPSLESCTRDTYASDTRFSLAAILRTAAGVASVAAHLHSQGILHGDLYPHNTLITEAGDCLLSDFGAAAFYDVEDRAIASTLERLEVRAFGCLLEDMLDRCTSDDRTAYPQKLDALYALKESCMTPILADRPRFHEICELLA
jgi:hypothetical protein